MKILLTLFVLLLVSFASSAKQTTILCNFKMGDYLSDNYYSLNNIYNLLDFNVEFITDSKLDWQISNFSFPDSFKTSINQILDDEILQLAEIIQKDKLSKRDKNYLKLLLRSTGEQMTVNEYHNKLKNLSEKDKNDFLESNKIRGKNYLNILFIIIDSIDLEEFEQKLNQFNIIELDKNNIMMKLTLKNLEQKNVLVENQIIYPDIINNNTKNMMLLKIIPPDIHELNFESNCFLK
jgi:hypothetical protein